MAHSAVTSQQQLDRITGTVQRMMEVELEETDMWLAQCKLDIECYVHVILQANLRVLCFYHPWDCHPRHVTRPYESLHFNIRDSRSALPTDDCQ